MFSNIIIRPLKNKIKVNVFDSISKIKRFKSKSNIIFLLKITKNNKRNDNFEKKKTNLLNLKINYNEISLIKRKRNKVLNLK